MGGVLCVSCDAMLCDAVMLCGMCVRVCVCVCDVLCSIYLMCWGDVMYVSVCESEMFGLAVRECEERRERRVEREERERDLKSDLDHV